MSPWFSQFIQEVSVLLLGPPALYLMGGYVVGLLTMPVLRWHRRRVLKTKVDEAYFALRNVCEPETLNKAKPGNPDFMRSHARDLVSPIRNKLQRAGFDPPAECDLSQTSLETWFSFLRSARTKLG